MLKDDINGLTDVGGFNASGTDINDNGKITGSSLGLVDDGSRRAFIGDIRKHSKKPRMTNKWWKIPTLNQVA